MKPNSRRPIRRQRYALTLAATVAAGLAIPASSALAQSEAYFGPHMWGGSGWFFGPFMMVAVLVLIVLLTAFFVRWLGGYADGDRGRAEKTAVDLLRERFARGEIDKQEFEDRRRTLGA